MTEQAKNPFQDHYIPKPRFSHRVTDAPASTPPEVMFSATLEADLAKWKRKGYSCIGSSDVLSKAGDMGLTDLLKEQASRVGAEVVLFCAWPAKLKAVRRLSNGEIDLEAVVADPPASFSPRSYAVASALFLARLTDKMRTTTSTRS